MSSLTLAVVLGSALLVFSWLKERDTHSGDQVLAMSSIGVPHADATVMGPLSLLLINDHPAATDRSVQAQIERIVQMHRDQGWEVILDDQAAEVAVRKYLPPGMIDPKATNPLLRNTLLDLDLGGILRIKSVPGDGPPNKRLQAVMIAAPAAEDAPFLRLVVPVTEN